MEPDGLLRVGLTELTQPLRNLDLDDTERRVVLNRLPLAEERRLLVAVDVNVVPAWEIVGVGYE